MAIDCTYTIGEAHYAKGMKIVRCPSPDCFKTRAARLIGDGLKGRWSNREREYIASPAKVRRFERLYTEGFDACPISGQLITSTKEDSS